MTNSDIQKQKEGTWHFGLLTMLIIIALILSGRLCYVYLNASNFFSVQHIHIAAPYKHISPKKLKSIIETWIDTKFLFSISSLETQLKSLPSVKNATVKKIWPDTLDIRVEEKEPLALWNNYLVTAEGQLFTSEDKNEYHLPVLKSPESQLFEVLQVYEKLGKILAVYGLSAAQVELKNQSWILVLTNGVKLFLGKQELESKLWRFCKSWPAVFAEKSEQLKSVDMRYRRGMAVQWK